LWWYFFRLRSERFGAIYYNNLLTARFGAIYYSKLLTARFDNFSRLQQPPQRARRHRFDDSYHLNERTAHRFDDSYHLNERMAHQFDDSYHLTNASARHTNNTAERRRRRRASTKAWITAELGRRHHCKIWYNGCLGCSRPTSCSAQRSGRSCFSVNVADLNTVSAEAYSRQLKCAAMLESCTGAFAVQTAYQPLMVLPTDLRNPKPEWEAADCTGDKAAYSMRIVALAFPTPAPTVAKGTF
jgi:hypothetical protein